MNMAHMIFGPYDMDHAICGSYDMDRVQNG